MTRRSRFHPLTIRFVAALALAAAPTLAAPPAAAQPVVDDATRSAARTLAQDGVALFDKGEYGAALDKLARADELVHLATTGLMVARALEKLGRWVEASEKYLAVSRLELPKDAKEAQTSARTKAEAERAALVARLPQIEIQLDASLAGASVAIDGKPLPAALVGVKLPANPGRHEITAVRGGARATATIVSEEARSTTVTLKVDAPVAVAPAPPAPARPVAPAPAPAPASDPSSPLRTVGWVAVGLGAAGVVAGAITGGLAVASKSTLEADGCADGVCPRSAESDLAKHDTLRAVSMGTLYGGAGVAALGVVLLLVAPKGAPRATGIAVTPWVAPGDVGLRGTF